MSTAATTFSAAPPDPLPAATSTLSVMTSVSHKPRLGSSPFSEPLAKKPSTGKMSSRASACRMRGAPRNEPSALESVAANTPATTIHDMPNNAWSSRLS